MSFRVSSVSVRPRVGESWLTRHWIIWYSFLLCMWGRAKRRKPSCRMCGSVRFSERMVTPIPQKVPLRSDTFVKNSCLACRGSMKASRAAVATVLCELIIRLFLNMQLKISYSITISKQVPEWIFCICSPADDLLDYKPWLYISWNRGSAVMLEEQ